MSNWYLVKFLGIDNEVVYHFVIKTSRLARCLDVCRAWLKGNDNKYGGRDVVDVDCESIDAVGVF